MQLPEDLRHQGPLDLIVRMERCCGMLLEASVMTSTRRVIMYNLSKAVTVSSIIIASVGVVVECYLTRNDLEEFSESFTIFITQTKNLVKMISLFVHRKKILRIINYANENFFIDDKILSAEERTLIRRYLRNARRYAFIFWVQWATCLALMSASNSTTGNGERNMPIKIWVPFDTKESPYYELGYMYNTLSSIVVSWNVALADSLFFTVIVQMTAQFELLANSLRTLGQDHKGIHYCKQGNVDKWRNGDAEYGDQPPTITKREVSYIISSQQRPQA
jgi:hypothetical protein